MPDRERIVSRYVRQYNERKIARKRRKFVMLPIKIVFGAAFVGVLAYFVVQIFLAVNTPMTTATALPAVVYDEFSIVGYFARHETVLSESHDGILVYTVGEGDKISTFGEYAAVYENSQAALLKESVSQLEERIRFLNSALDSSMDTTGIMSLSSHIYDGLINTAELADGEEFTRIMDSAADLKSNIITRELTNTSPEAIERLIKSLELQRDSLNEMIGDSETVLTSDVSGFFTSHIDGYEQVFIPEELDELSPSRLEELMHRQAYITPNQVGRVVTDFNWYFVANIPAESAKLLRENQFVNLRFDAMGDELTRVKIEEMSREENGEVCILFSSSQYMRELVNLRKQSAGIVLDTYEGLKVPKEAVRVDEDGALGVYVITGMYSEFKYINVLYETEDYYIVETDPTTTKSLLVYDFIIVDGKGLSNGKVIK